MYSDDLNDSQYEEETIEEQRKVKYDNGGNKIKLIIIGVLAIVLIVLIALVLSKGKGGSKNNNYVLSLYPETIVVPLGQTVNVSYDVRNNGEMVENPTVRLVIENEEIAKLENTALEGISYGKTMLIASYVDEKGKTVQEMKEVTVADGNPGTAITDVVVANGDLQLPPGGTYDLTLTIDPPNGYIENKKFTSSNSNVVMVDSTGKITAVGEGEATIIVDINNGAIKKQLKVYVNKNNTTPKIVVSPTKITIGNGVERIVVGSSVSLTYNIYPDEASKENIVWSTSDASILMVDDEGKITGKKVGEARIKVTTPNNISDSISVKVQAKEVPVTDIELSSTEISLSAGQTEKITPVVVPEDATDQTLTYESSDTNVASVFTSDEGATISGVGAGTATITIKSNNDITKTINVTVTGLDIIIDPGSGGGGGGSSCKKTCPDGQYVKDCKCITCEAGNYCKDGKKTACLPNYKSDDGASSCTLYSCPAGQGRDSHGACSPCGEGYVSPAGSISCSKKCEGTKVPNADRSACVDASCPAGQYFNTSSRKCEGCPSGKVCAGGASQPQSCGSGSKPNSGKTGCESCSGITYCQSYGGDGVSCKCNYCDSNHVTNNNGSACVAKSSNKKCSSIGTSSTCLANGCKWDYTRGCY